MAIDYGKLRQKFAEDRAFAEKFFKMSTELDDFRIDEIKAGPKLPYERDNDPEMLVVWMKGHDNKKDRGFEYVLYEECEKFVTAQTAYVGFLWTRYNPVSNEDIDNLPDIWGVSFISGQGSKNPLLEVRAMCNADGIEPFEVDTGDMQNLVNVDVDSDIMKLIDFAVS